jgi:hypothetical protein
MLPAEDLRDFGDKPGLVAEGEEKIDFLQTSDLDGVPEPADDFSRTRDILPAERDPQPVTSLLNSRLLNAIARAALDVKDVTAAPRRYIAKTLHVYMTLSNLRGVPYSVPFDGDAEPKNDKDLRENCYHMISHGDRVHYAVTGWARGIARANSPIMTKSAKSRRRRW